MIAADHYVDSLEATAEANYNLGFQHGYQRGHREANPMLHYYTPHEERGEEST